ERGELLDEGDAARLLVPMARIVDAVADVLAAVILARPRPQIRAVASIEIAPAVVLLGLVEDALDRPGFDLLQLVRRHGERVDRAGVPGKRRIAAPGAAGGNVMGARLEAAAVVEMGRKIHVRFARVNGADHETGHAGRLLDRRVARAVGDNRARDLARALELGRGDLRAVPHAVIAELGLFRRRGHSLSPLKKPPEGGGESFSLLSHSTSAHPREGGGPRLRLWIPSRSAFTRVFDALCAGMSGAGCYRWRPKAAVTLTSSLPGLTRQSIFFAKTSCEEDGPAGRSPRVTGQLRRVNERITESA